jgi:hypothetical protein
MEPDGRLGRLRCARTKTLSAIINGRSGITMEMAVRLSMAFSTSVENWLSQQTQYDFWHAEQLHKRLKVRRVEVTPGEVLSGGLRLPRVYGLHGITLTLWRCSTIVGQ